MQTNLVDTKVAHISSGIETIMPQLHAEDHGQLPKIKKYIAVPP